MDGRTLARGARRKPASVDSCLCDASAAHVGLIRSGAPGSLSRPSSGPSEGSS